jgi:hypothetical protein
MCGAIEINRSALENILRGKAKTTFMKGGESKKSAVETNVRLAILAMAHHTDRRTFTIDDLLIFGKEDVESCEVLGEEAREELMEGFHNLRIKDIEAVITHPSYHFCLSYDREVQDITITDKGADAINKAKAI